MLRISLTSSSVALPLLGRSPPPFQDLDFIPAVNSNLPPFGNITILVNNPFTSCVVGCYLQNKAKINISVLKLK